MTALSLATPPMRFPRVPLKELDAAMLVFELDRETSRLMSADAELITSAATMASFLHRKQTRFLRGNLPRVPYIEHPLRVALRLVRWGVTDAELVAAALLHDVVEDCAEELLEVLGGDADRAGCDNLVGASLRCLARLFGERVAHVVGEVTNPSDGTSYRDHIARLAGHGSEAAVLLKASDLKDNAGSIRHQLGHGEDHKMMRRVRKYQAVLPVVTAALEVGTHTGAVPAAREMTRLAACLADLTKETHPAS